MDNANQSCRQSVSSAGSRWQMLGYASGECAYSLVANAIFGFAMLYYTEALTFLVGPAIGFVALPALRRYSLDREGIASLRLKMNDNLR